MEIILVLFGIIMLLGGGAGFLFFDYYLRYLDNFTIEHHVNELYSIDYAGVKMTCLFSIIIGILLIICSVILYATKNNDRNKVSLTLQDNLNRTETVNAIQFCRICGQQLSATDYFCSRCGNRVMGAPNKPEEEPKK